MYKYAYICVNIIALSHGPAHSDSAHDDLGKPWQMNRPEGAADVERVGLPALFSNCTPLVPRPSAEMNMLVHIASLQSEDPLQQFDLL